MHSRVRVAAMTYMAGIAGIALALSAVAVSAGSTPPTVPAVDAFRPVEVPAAAPAVTAPARSSSPIYEADISPAPHVAPDRPAIRSASRSVAKPRPAHVASRPRPSHRSTTRTRVASVAYARSYARARIGGTQFDCLDRLWTKESGWNPRAFNRASGAYGIPQALPGSKMATFGSDWRYNPLTQVRWGLDYVRRAYGTACNAWSHSVRYDWY